MRSEKVFIQVVLFFVLCYESSWGHFNLFISQAEVKRLLGKQKLLRKKCRQRESYNWNTCVRCENFKKRDKVTWEQSTMFSLQLFFTLI